MHANGDQYLIGKLSVDPAARPATIFTYRTVLELVRDRSR